MPCNGYSTYHMDLIGFALETLCQVGPVLIWTLRISSGVSEGVYKLVEQSDREFLNIGVGDRQ